MGKLIATSQMTLDGVIGEVDKWIADPGGDHGDYSMERQRKSSGLVLGRKTYEGLAGYWPNQPDDDPWAAMVNPLPKFVASRTLEGPLDWNATLIEGELESGLEAVKEETDGELFCHGIGEFAYSAAQAGLVDEYLLFLTPLSYGGDADRLFHGEGPVRMELAEVLKFDSGVLGLRYLPAS